MYFEEQQQLPVLLSIDKKKTEPVPNKNNKEKPSQITQNLTILPKSNISTSQKESRKMQKQVKINLGPDKIDEFDKKFKTIHDLNEKKQEKEKKKVSHRQKQVQKSKSLITEMMRKIDAKTVTEQLYPVTNQTIAQLIRKMDVQIDDLKSEAQRKQNSLSSNPNNQHLKSQIEVLKSSIDRCVTIKQLYNEKINLRNKISTLERNIITLKQENRNLKIKISHGIETISNHMHNLPCEKQKELILELNKCQAQLRNQKQMRQKLEGNISDIVLNFKRLYQEADTARLIITNKLKELQQKQKKLTEFQPQELDQQYILFQKKSLQVQAVEQKKMKRSIHGTQDLNGSFSQTNKKVPQYYQLNHSPVSIDQNKSKQKSKQVQKVRVSAFSLEQQIKKMRYNQANLSKNYYK